MTQHSGTAIHSSHSLRRAVATAVLCGLPSVASPAHAAARAALMAGYGVSFFDDDFMRFLGTTDHGEEIPIGLSAAIPLTGGLSAGLELRVSLIPFSWDYRLSDETVGEATVSQNVISAVLRYDFLDTAPLPYIRAGLGLYSGTAGLQGDPTLYPDENLSFRRSLGVSVGAGLQGPIGSDKFWFGEVVFHAVRRTLDVAGYDSWRAHNLAVQMGVGRLF